MKNIFATFSFLLFFTTFSFGQIKFDDAFNISKKRSCYDLSVEEIDFSKDKQKDGSVTLKVEILLKNTGSMEFNLPEDATLELNDLSEEPVNLKSWTFKNLEMNGSETFILEKTFSPDEILPKTLKAKVILPSTFGECNLFNNSKLVDLKF